MKIFAVAIILVATPLACTADAQTSDPPGGAIEHIGPLGPSGETFASPQAQAPALTAAQKTRIFEAVIPRSRSETTDSIDVAVGDPVPPVDLHPLPAEVLGQAPAARPYRYTIIADQVALIDPGTLRVVDVIKP